MNYVHNMTNSRIRNRASHRVWLAIFAALFLYGRSDAQETSSTSPTQIWMCSLDLQTSQSTKLFQITHLASVGSPSLSSDRQHIAFEGALPGAQPTSDSHVWVCNIDGSEMQDLGPGAMPTWSPRGKRIAFCKHSPEHGVWVMQADGSHQQLIDEAGWCAQWSPNGNMIAYTRRVNKAADFVVFNLVEDEFFPVFGDGSSGYTSFYWNFAWSPDSKRLCFKGQGPNSEIHVASVAVHNGLDLQVHLRGNDTIRADFAWVDTNTVAFTLSSAEHEPNKLVTVQTNVQQRGVESAPQPIAGQLQNHANGSPAVSTDGRTLIYISRLK